MAIVTVQIMEGRSEEVKDALVRDITDVMLKHIDPDPTHIRVLIDELKPGNYSVGGRRLKPGDK